MGTDLQKKIEEIDKQLSKKFGEIRDLKALKKSYEISQKLEQKVFKKKTEEQVVEGQTQGENL